MIVSTTTKPSRTISSFVSTEDDVTPLRFSFLRPARTSLASDGARAENDA